MEMTFFFILAVVPLGVYCSTVSAAPTATPAPDPPTYALAEDDDEDGVLKPLFSDLRNLTDEDAEKYLNGTCHHLNNRTEEDGGGVYINTMEQDAKGGSTKIDGPHGTAYKITDRKTLETRFYNACPGENPAKCENGYTIAFWFSILSDDPKWAENWPGDCRTTLVSINNHIMITSNTKKGSTPESSVHEVQIHLNPNTSNKQSWSLSNKVCYLMEGNIKVCKDQKPDVNCTGKPDQQIDVGWQWNHFAMVVKNDKTFKVRLYWNGNAVPESNITAEEKNPVELVDPENDKLGIILNKRRDTNEVKCNDIGFDNFGMWDKPLTHGEILQLHSADFCDSDTATTKPPATLPIADIIKEKPKTAAEAKEISKNQTLAAEEVGNVLDTFTVLNGSAEEVIPEQLKKHVDETIVFLDALATSEDVFQTNEGGDTAVTTDLAKKFVGALDAALDITEKSALEPKDKQDVTQKVVDTCTELTKSLLSSDYNTPVSSDGINIEFHETAKAVVSDGENAVAKIGNVEVPKSVLGDSTKIAVLTIKLAAIKHIPVAVATSENQVETAVASDIKVIQMNGKTEGAKFTQPIKIRNTITAYNSDKPVPNCVYMTSDNKWATDGLETEEKGKDSNGALIVVCVTSHLTNFAVLMSVTPIKISESHAQSLSTLTIVCVSISLIALFIGILILFIFRELRGTRISILKHLSIAMFIAQLMFITAVERATYNRKLCLVIAVFIHYMFLSVFFWMLAQGIFLYMKLRLAVRSDANIVWFCLIGWGFPAVMVTVTAGINIEAYGREDLCWLNISGGGVWAFVGPVLAIVVINSVVIVMAMKAFTSVKSFKDKDDKEKFKSTLKAMVVMLPLLGLTWFFGVFAHIPGTGGLAFMYIFALCNGLQGLFLFLFHIVFNAEVQKVVKHAILRRSGSVGAEEPSFIRKMMGPESGVTQTSDFGKSSM